MGIRRENLIPPTEFVARRQRFMEQMQENSVAFFAANSLVTRSNDTEYLFCQNKYFYYLTGFNEPDAVLVLVKSEKPFSYLFCLPKDPQAEVWHGRRIGEKCAKKDYLFEQTATVEQLDDVALELLANKSAIYYCQGDNQQLEQQVSHWLGELKAKSRLGISAPKQVIDCQSMLDEMRLIKSDAELDVMRQINIISGKAHQRAMEKAYPQVFEYQIEAELLHEFARHGARYAAYNSIVAGGDNANILHYTDNSDPLTDGDLLLIDAGGELAGYAADITRTFPVNGKFNAEQKALYQLVLDAQQQCIDAIKPGQTLAALNELCCQVLTKGLLALGILQGDFDQLMAEKTCKKYFIHGLGHWLGLDVHDVGDYQVNDRKQMRPFKPGMVMTIEPGLYFPSDDDSVDKKWRGIGIRIEDNVLVTDLGHENLTVNAPKSVAEIEALMANAKQHS